MWLIPFYTVKKWRYSVIYWCFFYVLTGQPLILTFQKIFMHYCIMKKPCFTMFFRGLCTDFWFLHIVKFAYICIPWYTVYDERGDRRPPGGPRVGPGGRGHLENCIAAFVDIILSEQPAATAYSIAGRIDERRIIANTIPPGTRRGKRQGRAKGTNSDKTRPRFYIHSHDRIIEGFTVRPLRDRPPPCYIRPTGADDPAHKK